MAKEPEKQWEGKSRGGRWGYTFFISMIRLFEFAVPISFWP